ncbi:MAG: hypothetical protein ACLP3K_02760 [Candidatus Acidiferrales bacterium]
MTEVTVAVKSERIIFLHSFCGAELQRKPGAVNKAELPAVLYCPQCGTAAHEWESKEKRETELSQIACSVNATR